MSFFNSVEYLEITALWIAAYFAFSKYFPGRHVAFLLAMSLWWAHGFFGIPFSFLAVRLVALCIFYWAGTFFVAGRAKTIAASGLFAATIFFWLYLRFPNIMYYFDLPSPKGSEFWRHWVVYFVGVPYTVCRLISFVVDSRKGRAENPGLLRFLLYVCYFPTLLSGPVTNYSAFTRVAPPRVDRDFLHSNVVPGIKRITIGIFKRQLLTSFLWSISLPYIVIEKADVQHLWIGAYAYYLYLFVDFSGFTDLAVGVSKIMNVEVPENFHAPLLARNPRDFWQRWHISFLDWLNQYVMTPLYSFELRYFPWVPLPILSLIAILATFLFAGVWHGEGTRFLAYGALNGMVLWAYRIYDEQLRRRAPELRKRLLSSKLVTALSVFLCFHYVVFALMVFSLDRPMLRQVLGRMWNG